MSSHSFRVSTLAALCVAMLLAIFGCKNAFAYTLPGQPNVQFQTSGPSRAPTIGDWYTSLNPATGSTDRLHRFIVEVNQEMLDANGGSVNITINDAESNGALDEVDGGTFGAVTSATTSDPTRFELRAPGGVTVLDSEVVPTGSPNGTSVVFTVTQPGSYVVTSVTGAGPINGDYATTNLNNDDNTFTLNVPGNTSLIGQYQSTLQHSNSGTITLDLYFLVGPGRSSLALRNFDYDTGSGNNLVTYIRPNGSSQAGTSSGNGVWNGGSGTVNSGQDTISGLQTVTGGAPDAGIWTIRLSNFTAINQVAVEVNADGQRLTLLDQPPTNSDAGNFGITPDTTLSTTPGTPVDHPFTVTNFFFTNDIINFTLSNTAANYTVQLLDENGNAITDSDGNGDLDTGVLTTNQSKNFILRVTPGANASTADNTRVTGTSFMDVKVEPLNLTTHFVTKTTTLDNTPGVSGTIYEDLDFNGTLGGAETGTGVTGLYVKAIPGSGGNAVAAGAVNPTTGGYSITGLAAGEYTLVLDNNDTLTDVTPSTPSGFIGTEAPTGTRVVIVAGTTDNPNQNFGLFRGSILSGTVFEDDGTGGGTANNGVRDGGEVGLSGIALRLTNNSGSTTYDSVVTDTSGGYSFYIRNTLDAQPLRVVETNGANYISTGGTAGNTGGSYSRTSDATTFTSSAGTNYSAVNFGDVPINQFTLDNSQVAAPGSTVLYPHVFTAGSAGSVTFSASNVANPANALWSHVLYRDLDADGTLDAGEPIINAPISVAADQSVAVLVQQFVPANAGFGAQNLITVTASFEFSNASPALSSTHTRTDLTTVGTPGAGNGLQLLKSVDKTAAVPGEVVTYTITYRNATDELMTDLVINDATPAFTTFVAASNGPLPLELTAVSTAAPAVDATGAISWSFTGALRPGASGTVSFQVRVR